MLLSIPLGNSEAIDVLKILVKGFAIEGAAAFNTLAVISSIPVALEVAAAFNTLAVISSIPVALEVFNLVTSL